MILYWYALNVSRMLTEGVEGVSTVMYENVLKSLTLNSCLDKKERCLNFWQPDEFSKYSMSGSPYFVDVELIR